MSELNDAMKARDAGMEAARTAERVQAWRAAADLWLDTQPAGTLIVADDLFDAIGLPGHGVGRNNVVGATFAGWAAKGRINKTGRRRVSGRKIGHGNEQREWRVA